jgi:uncharacterized protein DUF4440
MHRLPLLLAILIAMPASAAQTNDARPVITRQLQALMDATSSGDATVWERLLAPDCLYVEEDDTIKSKADMMKETVPLPKGISGTIRVEILRFHQDGDIAVAVHRDHETENYFGQVLHAEYLTTTTWRHGVDGWRLIAGQVLAEPIDPPAVKLPPAALAEYAGTYRLENSSMTYSVAANGAELLGARAGKPPTLLNAELKDVFFVAGKPRIRMIFQRDTDGRIVGYASRREGRDAVWDRLK